MAKPPSRPTVSLVVRVGLLCVMALLALAVPASAEPTPPVASDPVCHNVASGPDYVLFLCVDLDAQCRIYTVTYGHEGATTTRCVLA
ncbi:MAG: hypothetical protein QOJ26_762 [Thermoplasmata archaeon]|nr:hypothetical protein [Thermoplasmata archaeon]